MSIMELYALLPIGILGLGSVAVLLAGAFAGNIPKRYLNLAGATIGLASAVFAVPHLPGGHEVGGMISTGPFDRLFVAFSGLVAAFTLLLSAGYTERRPLGREEYPALVLFAAFGMDVLASAVSLLGLFLGLECMSLALYILLASNRDDALSGEAGLKYLVVGAVSTAFLSFGLALIYAQSGTLSIPGAMAALTADGVPSPAGLAGWAFIIVGFGFKASLFPFHLWAPDVYEGGPAPVVAFLSTGSKAAVMTALLKLVLSSGMMNDAVLPALWAMAAATMVFGNLAALTQENIKRLLAYSSMAQMGYVLMAVIAAPATGPGPAMFYIFAYTAMDMGAFGVVAAMSGRDSDMGDISRLRGLGYVYPLRSAVLTVCLISLAGLPPTAGFMTKFQVFYAAVGAGYVYLAVIGILTAIVSVYYYLKVVVALYMRPVDEAAQPEGFRIVPSMDTEGKVALVVIALVIFVLGVMPGGLMGLLAR